MLFKFNAESVVRFIAQGWHQPTLGYACSVEINAVRKTGRATPCQLVMHVV